MEKRKYLSGYNIDWKTSKKIVAIKNSREKISSSVKEEIRNIEQSTINPEQDKTITASADNSISAIPLKEKTKFHSHTFEEECDVILLTNGNEIKAKVLEVGRDSVRYKKCEEPEGLTYTLKKSDVFMIKYPNGTKDVINKDEPDNVTQKTDSGIFGILSILSIIGMVVLIAAGIGGGVEFLILIPAAIVLGAIGSGRHRKNRGLAIAGLVAGIAMVVLLLALIAIFSSWYH